MSGVDFEQLYHTKPPYLSALGLNNEPFTSAHQDVFLYLDTERDQISKTLHELAQQKNLLLIVTGEHGIGKTSLLKRFVKTANEDWSVCEVQANTMMDAYQLLASIAHGFGLQVTDQPAAVLQDTLYQYLITIQDNDQSPVLLIDDAHELPGDALHAIFTLADVETGNGSLLRIILFCEPQIEIMLESPSIQPLRERITHTMEIPPFSEEQTAEYIKHRLAVSGFTGTSPFKPNDIKNIYQVSHGVPARINELAHLHLTGEDYAPTNPELLPEEFTQLPYNKKRIAAGIIVITLVISGLLLQNTIGNLFNNDDEHASIIKPLPVSKQENTVELATDQKSQITQPAASPQLAIQPAEPVAAQPEPVNIKSTIRSTLPNPVTGSNNKQLILINGDGFSEDTNVIVGWTGNNKKLDRSQITYENRNQLRIEVTVGNKADNWTIQTSDPVYGKSNIHQFKVTAAPVTGLQSASWITQQKPDQFTLQLLGTYNRYSLTSFVKQHNLDKDTAFFTTRRNGRNWYTLVHGLFETRDEAKLAIDNLASGLKNTKPWIRRFDGVQAIIKSSNTTLEDAVDSTKAISNNNAKPQSLDLTAHAAWLWSQNPEHFTLQLLAGHNLDALRSFMQKHQLEKHASFYRTRRDNKQWFVLLYGSYPEHNQATKAIEKLPAEIRKSRPWPRRFIDIHSDLSSQ